MATFKIPVLFLIKSRTFLFIERFPLSSYTGVIHFQKWSGFLAHPVLINGLDWIEGEATSSRSSSSFCASHPMEPVVTYCRDCEKALCERCRSLGGLYMAGTCPHSTCCELSAAAHTARAQLEDDEQVPLVVVVFSNHRAGVRHIRDVRPNKAADFRGCQF